MVVGLAHSLSALVRIKNGHRILFEMFHFVEINECLSFPCKNGGTCINQLDGFLCFCPTTYRGRLCETRKILKKFVTNLLCRAEPHNSFLCNQPQTTVRALYKIAVLLSRWRIQHFFAAKCPIYGISWVHFAHLLRTRL